ncbi:hypothetical protein ACLMJK_001470 [Lecanora helva]
MAIGVGIGDFLAVSRLCWQIYTKCKDASGNYADLSNQVITLHGVMKETMDMLAQQTLSPSQETQLGSCQKECEAVLKDLDQMLIKYESLGSKSQKTFDRLRYGMEDVNGIRIRLISSVSMLEYFVNLCSHAKLERKMSRFISEVRAGKREGSVVSAASLDSVAKNDRQTWKLLRRELEDVGVSAATIKENQEFIVAWFQRAVAAGDLGEGARSDAADVESGTHYDMKSSMIKPETGITRSNSRFGRAKSVTRRRLSDLVGKLVNLDDASNRFFEAVKRNDFPQVHRLLNNGLAVDITDGRKNTGLMCAAEHRYQTLVRLMLERGANINAQNMNGNTALMQAAKYGDEAVVVLLLENGADTGLKTRAGYTALMQAAAARKLSVTRILIDHGADVEARNLQGKTAAFHAKFNGDLEMLRLLRGQENDQATDKGKERFSPPPTDSLIDL